MLFFIKRFLRKLLFLSDFSPIALLWIIKAILIDWFAKKQSFSKLPVIGSKMGLKHKKSDYLKEFGELFGRINGHEVNVKPCESTNPIISVKYINTYRGLELSLSKPNYKLDKNVVNFKTSNRKFNRTFKTIRVSKNKAANIKNNDELTGLIMDFYTKWIFKLDSLNFSDNEIFCRLRYGFYLFPYIPTSKFKSLVNELLALAEKIDSALSEKEK